MQAILLAVHDAALVEAIRPVLDRAGYRLVTATDSREALDRLRRGLFELLITSADLPPESGIALVERMRGNPLNGDVPAIVLTSDSEPPAEPPLTFFLRRSDIELELLPAVRQLLSKD